MHLYLIGYRGSGKSTVGRLLAEQIDREFVDTDDEIESSRGVTIREIFESVGESGFRDLEERAVADVAKRTGATVVALGGGAVLRASNRDQISRTGRVVWLQGSPEQLFRHISQDCESAGRRPNLSDHGGYDEVVEVLAAREPVYRKLAQMTLLTDGRKPDELVAEIAAWVKSRA